MKTAILIHSDPNTGEEALGRLFNALAAAHDVKQQGGEVRILFLGTGTRWISTLSNADHPAHGLFKLVSDQVEGVSQACADVFGTSSDVDSSEFNFVNDNPVPGTSGLPSVPRLMNEGYSVLVY
jgi:hypothetical protein